METLCAASGRGLEPPFRPHARSAPAVHLCLFNKFYLCVLVVKHMSILFFPLERTSSCFERSRYEYDYEYDKVKKHEAENQVKV
jgi:hypothetical protein